MKKPKKLRIEVAKQNFVWLNSGSTLYNLAVSDNPFRGYRTGGYYLIRGDSSSGKTLLAGTAFAEAAINKKFDEHELIFDNIENGALFFEKFFGKKIADRIQPPNRDKDGQALNSETVEDFYDNLFRVLRKGKPVVYIADSETALTSDAEIKKQDKQLKARSTGKEEAGSMGDAKAKIHSQYIRRINFLLKKTNSILIIICQTRDNMGFGAMFEPKTSPGGKALKFYAMAETWTSLEKKIKKTVNGKPRNIGVNSKAVVKKNRFTGKTRSAVIPIYQSFGVDDTGSCVDYLLEEGIFKQSKGSIVAKGFNHTGTRESLIQFLEEKGKLKELRTLVGETWNNIEKGCEVKRVSKYV